MKFGGASVKSPDSFARLAELVIQKSADYSRIAIVISAMGGMTDQLIALAKQVHPHPPRREYDMLVSVGERISISLLAMALALKNRDAVSFTGSQSGIMTCADHGEAKILEVRPGRLEQALNEGKIVIVAGFQGVSLQKEITTLGRGGSDTSAVALGIALNAKKIEFYKDVPGIFNDDPKKNEKAEPFSRLSFDEALTIIEKTGGKVLHPRAIKLAQKNHLSLHVLSFEEGNHEGTWIVSPETFSKKERCYEV